MRYCNILLLTLLMHTAKAQQHIPLYSDNIPNSKDCSLVEERLPNGRVLHVTKPELIVFYPQQQDSFKAAAIICPGGGYQRLAIDHEGYDVAKALNKIGIVAFVLKYRLPNDTCVTNKKMVPLQDVQQAMYWVKVHSKEYGINENNIGIMGFSAGGHLAAMLSTHYNYTAMPFAKDTLLRPAFAALIYPVITMNDSLAHSGSKERLIGKNAVQSDVDFYSCEKNVTTKTPPTFLVLAADDKTVNPENSIQYYTTLRKQKVATEIHIYQNGGHGFGMNLPNNDSWTNRFQKWLLLNNFISN